MSGAPPDGHLVTGATTLFGIVGDPIAQAKSPAVWNPLIARAGVNAALVPLHIREADFADAIGGVMRVANVTGLVFTLPFKQKAMALADNVRPIGAAVGAVNALRREADGTWTGEMFDGLGLVNALAAAGVPAAGRRVMLLGAGGAGSAIALSLALAGASAITLHDPETPRAEACADCVRRLAPDCAVTVAAPDIGGADILVNASPVGMAPGDGLPAAFPALPASLTVADIVPAPTTALLRLAAEAGCRTVAAGAMVGGQARAILDFFGIDIGDPA
ncbi:shikimate dehydrogenase family protein [Acuticoccus kandeliae]|uniref:shikimate dehydrogenase family protein n=1 Tax=Acuticoccus kandeliae TaxID=2073160 RepID=UPI000D3E06F8|nr:shikimate dehydrogenase [Acuticoccus kandeliae]